MKIKINVQRKEEMRKKENHFKQTVKKSRTWEKSANWYLYSGITTYVRHGTEF